MKGRTSRAAKIAAHLRKYLLAYVLLTILVALPIGHYGAEFFASHKSLVKNVILLLAIGTLLPSMIQLRASELGKELRAKPKEIALALVLALIITPLLAMLLADYMGHKVIGVGYVAANAVPASSASLAYVMIAEGNLELATVLVLLSVVASLVLAPVYVGVYAQTVNMNLPLPVLAKSVTIALLVPLLLGQAIRRYMVRRAARALLVSGNDRLRCREELQAYLAGRPHIGDVLEKLEEAMECVEERIIKSVKPLLSLWTLVFMLMLIFVLIASKAELLIEKPIIAAHIIVAQVTIYVAVIALLIIASRALKICYKDHMAIAFISLTKNQSVAAAMAVLAIGPTAALPAALIPAIQPVIAVLYISAAPYIKKVLGETS